MNKKHIIGGNVYEIIRVDGGFNVRKNGHELVYTEPQTRRICAYLVKQIENAEIAFDAVVYTGNGFRRIRCKDPLEASQALVVNYKPEICPMQEYFTRSFVERVKLSAPVP